MRELASYWNSKGLKLIHNFIDSVTRRIQHGIEMEEVSEYSAKVKF